MFSSDLEERFKVGNSVNGIHYINILKEKIIKHRIVFINFRLYWTLISTCFDKQKNKLLCMVDPPYLDKS